MPCWKPMLRQRKWEIQKGPITKNCVLPVTTFSEFCCSTRTFFIHSWFDVPITQISMFILSTWVLFESAFCLWVSLNLFMLLNFCKASQNFNFLMTFSLNLNEKDYGNSNKTFKTFREIIIQNLQITQKDEELIPNVFRSQLTKEVVNEMTMNHILIFKSL